MAATTQEWIDYVAAVDAVLDADDRDNTGDKDAARAALVDAEAAADAAIEALEP